ncbi:MAG: type II toxin-antitoxin system HicA family toxin [Proteobacteria bacterium]|nr:type II toxin-antitoxin system HicA family toxin [Pseudomonadota bacterium]
MVEGFTVALKKLLREAGCEFVRAGHGDHEIWRSPITRTHFVVDGKIKSRHTANAVLRQVGLPKQF